MREDTTSVLADYRGLLEWDSFSAFASDGVSVQWPDITIELYIKDHTLPIRKPKITEVSTIPTRDPAGDFNVNSQAVFYSAPDILQVQLSGWIISPIAGAVWQPQDRTGQSIESTFPRIGNICYPELICAFIEGRMQQGPGGSIQRRDPDRYVTPHGDVYDTPVIAEFDWAFTTNRRKQTFNMTLWLES